MGRMQRTKGATGEREFFALVSAHLGKTVKRELGQARDGGCDGVCGPLLFEVKRRQRIAILRWMEQARRAASTRQGLARGACVAMREDDGEWMVLCSAELFLMLAGEEILRLWPEGE